MAYQAVDILPLEDQPVAYNYPTYRYCRVCEIINFVDFGQADKIRAYLEEAWGDIASRIDKAPRDYGLSEVSFDATRPLPDFHEGPAESFPKFRAKLSYEVEVKAIITVCIPPHHSKLWVRVSSIDEDSFNEEQLGKFYSKASNACEKIADLLSEGYKDALAKEKLEDELVRVHEIHIETASSDLKKIEDFLQDDSMKMVSVLGDRAKFRSLSGFMSRVCEKTIDAVEDIGDDVHWFKMRVSKPKRENLVGVYSKRHGLNVTKFVGLVNKPPQLGANCITQEFSRKLVQHIAPVI